MKEIIAQIKEKAMKGRVVVTIDGHCAGGKTTLASMLSEALNAPVVHTDDFVVPHSAKTDERLSVPGGNCDHERLVNEVLAPWKENGRCLVRKYACHLDEFMSAEEIAGNILILEGSYSNLPDIRAFSDVRIFVNTSLETRLKRLEKRESAASLAMFHSRWIPLENAYFKHYNLPDEGCIII